MILRTCEYEREGEKDADEMKDKRACDNIWEQGERKQDRREERKDKKEINEARSTE